MSRASGAPQIYIGQTARHTAGGRVKATHLVLAVLLGSVLDRPHDRLHDTPTAIVTLFRSSWDRLHDTHAVFVTLFRSSRGSYMAHLQFQWCSSSKSRKHLTTPIWCQWWLSDQQCTSTFPFRWRFPVIKIGTKLPRTALSLGTRGR